MCEAGSQRRVRFSILINLSGRVKIPTLSRKTRQGWGILKFSSFFERHRSVDSEIVPALLVLTALD